MEVMLPGLKFIPQMLANLYLFTSSAEGMILKLRYNPN